MNTFFFGYLSLKWRRLVRILILMPYAYLAIYHTVYFIERGYTDSIIIYLIPIYLTILTPLTSWVVKPFVVKDKS
mgnify:CR=1 FL=1